MSNYRTLSLTHSISHTFTLELERERERLNVYNRVNRFYFSLSLFTLSYSLPRIGSVYTRSIKHTVR